MAEAAAAGGLHAQLSLSFGGFDLDVSLDLPGRGVSALFGPSGCGKTTVLRAVAGLERAHGHVVINGERWQDDAARVFRPTHRRQLGYVFQEASLFPHLSVRRNLDYGQRRLPPAGRRIESGPVLELLGIGHLLDRLPDRLSGGERQRVAIARALLASPRLLLMDEPLAALDAERKAEILPYIERLHAELAIPVLYVTHAMDEVARLADHLVLMRAGRVQASGELVATLARLDLPQGDEAGAVLQACVAEHDPGFGLSRVAFAGGSLWVGASALPVGAAVRARVLARDVSIALDAPRASSILNVLPARVAGLADQGADRVLVRLALGHAGTCTAAPGAGAEASSAPAPAAALLALITRRSCVQLALAEGLPVYAQVKGVALMR